MGTHSNYISVESDFNTVIFLLISIIVCVIFYFTFKIVTSLIKRHYYKQFSAEQRRVEQYKKIKAQKERAYKNIVNNFFYNRIEEDIEKTTCGTSANAIHLIKVNNEW